MSDGADFGGHDHDLDESRYLVDDDLRASRRTRMGSGRGGNDRRSSSQRDRARVLYSPYFQRLSGVTQVISPEPLNPRLHNRQMHTIKVALVAKEIAEDVIGRALPNSAEATAIRALGGVDAVVCEVAGLIHDLGHPPFGHVAESLLNHFVCYSGPFPAARDATGEEIAPEEAPPQRHPNYEPEAVQYCHVGVEHSYGFEGNAQSFRVVTRLDQHKLLPSDASQSAGLDLTPATLAAVLKYPWWRAESTTSHTQKYGVYPDDVAHFVRARAWVPDGIGVGNQTLEASIMDLADDVTYAVHDLQDFFVAGYVDSRQVTKLLRQQTSRMRAEDYEDVAVMTANAVQDLHNGEALAHAVLPSLEASYRTLVTHHPTFANRDDYLAALDRVCLIFAADLDFHFEGSLRQRVQVQSVFSQLIAEVLGATRFHLEPGWEGGPRIYPDSRSWHVVQVCKSLARSLVVESRHVGLVQRSQRIALTNLLHGLNSWLLSGPPLREVPEPLRTFLGDQDSSLGESSKYQHRGRDTRRCVVDHVCSLTDPEAMQWSEWLRGRSLPALGQVN